MAFIPETGNITAEDIETSLNSIYNTTIANNKFSTWRNTINIEHIPPHVDITTPYTTSKVKKYSHFRGFPFKGWTRGSVGIRNFDVSLNTLSMSDRIRYNAIIKKVSDNTTIAHSFIQLKRENLPPDESGSYPYEVDFTYNSNSSIMTPNTFVFEYEWSKGHTFTFYPDQFIDSIGKHYFQTYVDVYYNGGPPTSTNISDMFVNYNTSGSSYSPAYKASVTLENLTSTSLPTITPTFLNDAIDEY